MGLVLAGLVQERLGGLVWDTSAGRLVLHRASRPHVTSLSMSTCVNGVPENESGLRVCLSPMPELKVGATRLCRPLG